MEDVRRRYSHHLDTTYMQEVLKATFLLLAQPMCGASALLRRGSPESLDSVRLAALLYELHVQ